MAKSRFDESLPYLEGYNSRGGAAVVADISSHIDLSDIKIAKQREIAEKFLGYDAAKKEAFFNPEKQAELVRLNEVLIACEPLFAQYDAAGAQNTAIAVAKISGFSAAQTQRFVKDFKVDVEASLVKDLDKADNRTLNYFMMVFFAIFGVVYYYVEVFRKPTSAKINQMFKKLQLLSSAAFSLGHGGSDAQKVMGIIGAALIANGDIIDFKEIPNWVPLACYTAIALGTLSGGWKIVKTMGTRITKVTPLEGVGAETAGAITLFLTAQMGIPVSTTHTITGSIIGVGATKRLSAVRWGSPVPCCLHG